MSQTSGLVGTTTSANWTETPWTITSGSGSYPDGGGSASWNAASAAVPGTLATGVTLTLDKQITLSTITYNSPFALSLAGTAANDLALASNGGTLDVPVAPASAPGTIAFGHIVAAPIAGGGMAGLTKTGSGNLTISGTIDASTYTGGTHVNGGVLLLTATAAIGDAALGATGAGNGLSFDGGSLVTNVTGGWATTRDIRLDAGGGRLVLNTSTTIHGVIGGVGALVDTGFGAGAVLTLTSANTYTGSTTVVPGASSAAASGASLSLSGNGSIIASASYDFTGSITINDVTNNLGDRLGNAAPMTLRGTNLTLTGNASAASAETVGTATLASGISTLTVTPGSGQAASLTLAGLARPSDGTLYVRGANLGGAPGTAGVATIRSSAAPALIGGTGSAGSTTIPIVPWAIGNATTATTFTAAANVGASLVTYSTAGGFRPLATTEYATAFGGNTTDNVRLTASTAVGASATANAILFAPSAAASSNLSGGTIAVTSGAVLYSPTTNVTGTIAAGLNFGSAEGIIANTSSLLLSGPIAGSGGVTYSSPTGASLTTSAVGVTGTSAYTGDTRILAGTIEYSGTVGANGTAGPFGANGSVVLNPGTTPVGLLAAAASTLNRNLVVTGTGSANLGIYGGLFALTLNGDVSMGNNLNLVAGALTAPTAMTFNGTVSGAGQLFSTSAGYVVLNGNNTYSGGTVIGSVNNSGTFVAGSDTAFGTGPVYLTGFQTSAIAGSGTAPRMLANELFLSAAADGFAGTAALTFTGGVNLNGAATVAVTNTATTTFAGVVANGAMVKTGAGLLVMSGANTFTGGTNVSAGSVRVNNASGSGTGSGAVLVAASATLGGSGRIEGAVAIASGGTITAGSSDAAIGTLTTGAQTWSGNASGGGLVVKTDGATADQLVMSGLGISATPAAPFLVTALGSGVQLSSGEHLLIATDSDTSSPSPNNPFADAIAARSLVLNTTTTTVAASAGNALTLMAGSDASGGYELYLADTGAPEPASLLLVAVTAAPLLLGRRSR